MALVFAMVESDLTRFAQFVAKFAMENYRHPTIQEIEAMRDLAMAGHPVEQPLLRHDAGASSALPEKGEA